MSVASFCERNKSSSLNNLGLNRLNMEMKDCKIDSSQTVMFVGNVCMDNFNIVERYPVEDTGNRIEDSFWQRGGNASNLASVFSFLGGKAEFFGTLADDSELAFVRDDFEKDGVEIKNCLVIPNTSFVHPIVIISKETGSRTIIYTETNLRPLTLHDMQERIKLESGTYGWIHFVGRNENAREVANMINHVNEFNQMHGDGIPNSEKSGGIIISLEAEKELLVPEMDQYKLWQLPDIIFVSKEFAKSKDYNSMTEAVEGFFPKLKKGSVLVCAWGVNGAAAMSEKTGLVTSSAFPPEKIVDTCGAGDTFGAATIFALSKGKGLQEAIVFGCQVAGAKCGMQGYKGIREQSKLI